jgi:transcriptional regulator with XRE-family HTH domain
LAFFIPSFGLVDVRLARSDSLSIKRFDATVGAVKSFGPVCREIRIGAGLTQQEVALAGDLEQSRVSEIERGRYTPGLDLAARLAKGLGVPLGSVTLFDRFDRDHTEVLANAVMVGFHAAERDPPILVAAAVIENLREWWKKRALAIQPSVTSPSTTPDARDPLKLTQHDQTTTGQSRTSALCSSFAEGARSAMVNASCRPAAPRRPAPCTR